MSTSYGQEHAKNTQGSFEYAEYRTSAKRLKQIACLRLSCLASISIASALQTYLGHQAVSRTPTRYTCTRMERDCLTRLYETLRGSTWCHTDNWCSELELCKWYGVHCDEHGHVVRLELRDNNLQGQLSACMTTQSLIEIEL
jgi:hypothetical protein